MPGPIVLGQRFASPEAVPSPWHGVRFQWEGWDGSVWDLSADDLAGAYLMPGVRGLEAPPAKHYSRTTPTAPGSQWLGVTYTDREVFWPLRMWTDVGSTDFLALRRAFMRTLNPAKTGIWRVIQPNGDSRTLRCRFVSFDTVPESDPVEAGWAHYGIKLVADDPFWHGTTLSPSWGIGTAQEFFVAGPSNNVFFISSSSTISTAVFLNDGDVPAYPQWVVTGPTSAVTLGFGGKTINVGFPITEGQTLVIETQPGAQSAYLNGAKVTTQLGSGAKFAAVPPGEQISLSLSMIGSGRVALNLTPLFFEAY